jgi:predicted NUDIX family NTP pyrophosphohydrolase
MKVSAGLLMFRRCAQRLEVLLVHPGGPFWKNKDLGSWSIPKGEYSAEENPVAAAKREFEEETGFKPNGEFLPLSHIKQPSGKIITAWAFEGDCSPADIRSNVFSMEWPPKSGKTHEFPEVDRAEWFSLDEAKARILKGQAGFLDRLAALIDHLPAEKPNKSLRPDSPKKLAARLDQD